MSDPQMQERMAGDDPDTRRRTTIDRVQAAAAEPFTLSAQLVLAIMTTVFAALGASETVTGGRPLSAVLVVLGVATAWCGWVWARRSRRLQPFLRTPPAVVMNALARPERRSLRRVLAGRSQPVSVAERDLARTLRATAHRSDTAAWAGFVGLEMTFFGNTLARDEPWLLAFLLLLLVLFAVSGIVSAARYRRSGRVLAEAFDDADTAPGGGADR